MEKLILLLFRTTDKGTKMYAIVHKNNVTITSEKWYVGRLNSELQDLEINKTIYPSDEQNVPITIDQDTKILKYLESYPPINPRIQCYDGPTYDIQEDKVIANYYTRPLDLNIAKGILKEEITRLRYVKEITTIQIPIPIINDKAELFETVSASTDRETRSLLSSKLATTGNDFINWKFNEGWALINHLDLQLMILYIDQHVQSVYDWEFNKHAEVDNCYSLDDLIAVKIIEKPENLEEPANPGLPDSGVV